MKNRVKGEYAYINNTKRYDFLKMLVLIVIACAIFVLGLALNKNSKANIFTVIAVLVVLPWAKTLVEFIVLFPFQTPSRENYEKIKESLPQDIQLYSDMVITSTEKVMNLDFLLVGKGYVIGVLGKGGQDLSYIQTYLSKGIKNWSGNYRVKIHKDYKNFLQSIPVVEAKEIAEDEVKEVNAYIRSLIV